MQKSAEDFSVTEKMACDIVVVGSGVAGLTAAVQAVNLGKKVILLESKRHIGGNWNVTYGMMAVDSPISRAQGVEVDVRKLINQELRLFNHQVDFTFWKDMVAASGENISWLMDQGVEFVPELEAYTAGDINAPVYHRWEKNSNPAGKMRISYEKAGGRVLAETKGRNLLIDDGAVSGIIAERKNGELIRIDCAAVITAGGGFTSNREMVSRIIGITDYATRNIADNDGSTINMCIDAGAKSLLGHENLLSDLIPRKMTAVKDWLNYIHNRPGSFPFHVNVNQDGLRYVDESCTLRLYGFSPAAAITQEKTYRIYDKEKLQKLEDINKAGLYKVITTAAEEGRSGIIKADTFEELAEKLGLDPQNFAETMNTYNKYCEAGNDPDFEKNTDFLLAFNPPYYMWENGYQVACTFEGVDYNRKMERVLTPDRDAIPGLYVAGVDGAKLYRDYYSLSIPGSCNANNVYSGRVAAQNAAEYADAVEHDVVPEKEFLSVL